ncbi:hypothetical protein HMI56_001589 [Coelomomyces lativittatus]|nr:hypothetical protein HMI56_001589 [Coelomomyces lativittatus]
MPFTRPLAQKIIDFWYEGIVTLPYATIPKDLQKKWFLSNDPALDQSIRSTYEEQLIQLAQELNQPNIQEILDASSPLTQDNVCGIGAIILLDQFPRNMYRGTGKAFAYDHLACMLSKKLIHRLNSFPMNQRGTLLLVRIFFFFFFFKFRCTFLF